MNKRKFILDTLFYLEKFHNKIIVIKFGGSIYDVSNTLFCDVAMLKKIGIHPVLVHGGGRDVTREMEKQGIKSKFINGLRATDEKSINIVIKVLASIRKNIISEIKKYYEKCVGYPTKDKNIFLTEKLVIEGKEDLGYVGNIKKVNKKILLEKIKLGYIPVISSIGIGKDNKFYNINADTAASELAVALKSEKLFFLTDVDGIYLNLHNKNSLIKELNVKEAKELISKKNISSGMLPKLISCINAVYSGVKYCHIIKGVIPNVILLELFTESGCGTMIK